MSFLILKETEHYNLDLYLQTLTLTFTYYLVESLRTGFQQTFMTMPCHSNEQLSNDLFGKREAFESKRGGFQIPCVFIKPRQQRTGKDSVPELCP